MIYFDNASTTTLRPEVLETYNTLLTKYYANPSGVHFLAREVDRLQDTSRAEILRLLGYKDGRVIFTSSATEANNLSLIGLFHEYQNRGKEIITSPYEHPSVRQVLTYLKENYGAVIREVELLDNGQISLESLKHLLNNNTVLISIMAVNNEVGIINDLVGIRGLLKPFPKVIFHSDVTQGVGKVNIDYDALDALTFTAHKIGGLKGSGALVLRKKLKVKPLLLGGSQEDGYRAGTSNAPANIVLAKTLRMALENGIADESKVQELSAHLRQLLMRENKRFRVISPPESTYIVNFVPLTVKASVILNALDNEEVVVGTTSSCSAKIHSESFTVMAITKDNYLANNSLRISFSSANTTNEVDYFFKTLMTIIKGAE